jgi:hypothetical protein
MSRTLSFVMVIGQFLLITDFGLHDRGFPCIACGTVGVATSGQGKQDQQNEHWHGLFSRIDRTGDL